MTAPTTPPVTIRPATPDDAQTLVAFQLRMAHETEALHLDKDTVEKGVLAVFADPAKGRYYVAEKNGRLVGGTLVLPEWSDWRNGAVLWIHSVYVIPEARRGGVFTALYRHLREQVDRSPHLKGLRLYVDKSNAAAQHTYQALGMTSDHYQLYEWLK